MRAAIYARYSSDLQRDASIEDQVRICRTRIEAEGWQLAATYTDHAVSGTSRLRPGYQKLLEGARAGVFDIVVAEALDRLSRDQEDVAALYKHLSFSGVRLVTLAEGVINELHVGLKGTMNALYIKDLAQKTRRGLEGRVRQGRSGGGLCYGYEVVRELDARGEPVHGGRKINEAEAAVVRRIFRSFAAGKSPRAIAHELNSESVPGPGGRPWGDTTIRGHVLRRTGLLHNELYIGKLVWNKQRYVKDPTTSKRLARLNPESAWIVQEVPDLRIVDQPLWEQVQARLGLIRNAPRTQKALEKKFWLKRRPKHLLTGLAHCATCGAPLASVGKDYLGCSAARRHGTCQNRHSIRRETVEGLILDGLKNQLMAPEVVAEFVREFHAELNRQQGRLELGAVQKRRELDEVTRKLAGLIEAIADGLRAPGLQARLDQFEKRKAELSFELQEATPSPLRLHPNLSELYRKKVADLQLAIADPATRSEALEILRGLVERVEVHAGKDGIRIGLTGEIANMLKLSTGVESVATEPHRSSIKVVAGARFEPATSAKLGS
ncbi:MAG TPA: recombinase family protein [Stellaceae bacterium]|nr:recombinase family protein [Stellaceae bacterium]